MMLDALTSSAAFWQTHGDVHVWTIALDVPADAFLAILSSDERRRADRFHFAQHRQRFIVARGQLRILLGAYLARAPEQIHFRIGPYGKPELAERDLHFNLSHSHGLALVALRVGGAIGVDVEKVRPMPDADGLAERFFAARETSQLRSLPEEVRLAAFFRCWTRKEAYIKATGLGLSFPLDQFEVTLAPDEPARLLHVAGDPQAASRWTMQHLTPAEDFVAALAVEGPHAQPIQCRRLEASAGRNFGT